MEVNISLSGGGWISLANYKLLLNYDDIMLSVDEMTVRGSTQHIPLYHTTVKLETSV